MGSIRQWCSSRRQRRRTFVSVAPSPARRAFADKHRKGRPAAVVAPEFAAAILPQPGSAQFLRVYNRNMTTYPLPSDRLWHSLKEGSEFFQHAGDIYETLRRLADELDENGLDYALGWRPGAGRARLSPLH